MKAKPVYLHSECHDCR